MKMTAQKKHRTEYVQSVRFLAISLSLLAGSILIVIFLMISFAETQKDTVETSTINQLNQTHHNLLETVKNMEYLARQIYFDPALAAYSIGADRADMEKSTAARNQLSMYMANYSYLHSIYYYNARLDEFYTSHTGSVFKREVFFDVGAADIASDFLNYDGLLIKRTIPVPYQQVEKEVYTIFSYDKSAARQERRNIVMINVNADYILQYLQANNQENVGCTILMNGEGDVLGAVPQNYLDDAAQRMVRDQVLDQTLDHHNFTLILDGETQFAVSLPSDSVDWILVGIQPYSRLFHQADRMQMTVIIVSFSVIALLIVFITLLPKKVIAPMATMENIVESEINNRHGMAEIMQQQYLRMLLHSDMRNNRDEVNTRLAWLECRINTETEYRLLLLVFDFERIQMEEQPADQVKQQVKRKIQEEYGLRELEQDYFFVDAEFNQIVWAIDRGQIQLIGENNYDILRHIMDEIYQNTQIHFSVIVSEGSAGLYGLERIYAKTGAWQEQIFLTGPGSIIEAMDRKETSAADYFYPGQMEEQMLNAVRQGDEVEGIRYFDKLLERAVKTGETNVVMFTLRHVSMGLRTLFASLKGVETLPEVIGDVIPSLGLYHCSTVEDARRLFCQAISKLALLYRKPQESRHAQIVESAIEFIQENYADPDLDLGSLAGVVKLSSVYFGRMFKKVTGKAANVYIQEYRIDAAKKLLDETQDSIQQIAERTGFSSTSYFSTVFRRLCQMPPNEYRRRLDHDPK